MEYSNYTIQNQEFHEKHEVFSRGGPAGSAAWSHHLNKMAPIFPDMMSIMGGHTKQDDYPHGHSQDPKSNPSSMYEAKQQQQQQQPPPAHNLSQPPSAHNLSQPPPPSSSAGLSAFNSNLELKQEVVDVTPDIDPHHGGGLAGSGAQNSGPAVQRRRGKANECEVCHKVSTTRQNLKIHMRVHTGEKPYQCDFCQKRFTQACSLKIHTRIHTGKTSPGPNIKPARNIVPPAEGANIWQVTPYSNSLCPAPNRAVVGEPRDASSVKHGYNECEICHKVVTTKQNLKIHMRVHTGEKPYQCDFCQKRFAQACSLTIHTRIHTGERPHKCDFCEKGFITSQNLKTHRRTHTGEKPYQGEKPHKCDFCEKGFITSQNLKTHRRTHTGEKPYQCEVCQKCFSQICGLKTHRKTHERLQPGYMRDGAPTPSSLPPGTPLHRLPPTPSPQHQHGLPGGSAGLQPGGSSSPVDLQHRQNNGIIKTETATTVASIYENHRSTNLVPLALMK